MPPTLEEVRALLSIEAAEDREALAIEEEQERERNRPKNLCPPQMWAVARRASQYFAQHGIKHILIGSAAMAAQGIQVEVPDVDFLTDAPIPIPPDALGWEVKTHRQGYSTTLTALKIDGIMVDGVNDDRTGEDWRKPFFEAETLDIDDIRVAKHEDVIAIKKIANRKKDQEQMEEWTRRAAAVVVPVGVVGTGDAKSSGVSFGSRMKKLFKR